VTKYCLQIYKFGETSQKSSYISKGEGDELTRREEKEWQLEGIWGVQDRETGDHRFDSLKGEKDEDTWHVQGR